MVCVRPLAFNELLADWPMLSYDKKKKVVLTLFSLGAPYVEWGFLGRLDLQYFFLILEIPSIYYTFLLSISIFIVRTEILNLISSNKQVIQIKRS